MSDDPLKLLLQFVDLADPQRNANENEARNAAMKACELVRQHRCRITVGSAGAGKVHSLTLLFSKHGIRPGKASAPGWCNSCGEAIDGGARVAAHSRAGATHYECRAWWADFDFASLPPDYDEDIPF
jgi:hypothetical protein